MIVSARIFLILLLPLLVRGTGNQRPHHPRPARSVKLPPLPPPIRHPGLQAVVLSPPYPPGSTVLLPLHHPGSVHTTLELTGADKRLDAVILLPGTIYGVHLPVKLVKGEPLAGVLIPKGSYYYVPPDVDVVIPDKNARFLSRIRLSPTRIVRLCDANIRQQDIPENTNRPLHPILERVLIGETETVGDVDQRLEAVLLPPGSAYRDASSIIPALIPTLGYYRLLSDSKVIVTTPKGTFELPPKQIIRISPYADVSRLCSAHEQDV